MLDHDTLDRLLQRYPMLHRLSAENLAELQVAATLLKIPAGTVVFDENQVCQGFPLLLSGGVRVIKAAANGRELRLYRVESGESCILTSSCLLGHAHYHARGIADMDTEMIALSPALFAKLLSSNNPFREYVFSQFSERLTDLMQLVAAVAFQKLDQRLAALLANKTSPIHTTHQALADELGSVREIVSRLLKNFEEQGLIRLGREQIEIVDAAALTRISAL